MMPVSTDKLILVVEPDDQVAKRIVGILANAGYEVVRTTNAQNAIDRINPSDYPDVITFSVGADGRQLIQHLRSDLDRKRVLVIPRPEALDLTSFIISNFNLVPTSEL